MDDIKDIDHAIKDAFDIIETRKDFMTYQFNILDTIRKELVQCYEAIIYDYKKKCKTYEKIIFDKDELIEKLNKRGK